MAKKKSKGFIIPSFHFLTTVPLAKIKEPAHATQVAPLQSKPAVKANPEKKAEPVALEAKAPVLHNEVSKAQAPDLPNVTRRKSALSLSSLKRNKQEEEIFKRKKEAREEARDLPTDPFTQETFVEVWTTYVESLHDKGEKILASILKADVPVLKGHHIQLTYPNELMKVELLKVKPKVLRHLRKALNNYSVDFQIHVNEDTSKRFAYTPQEKYELLKEKNEAIAFLRKTFNLEL
jgi:DNA polymerase-3 subunit gamma/tau